MALYHSPLVVTNGLILYLDAGNTKSYPGSGTTWYDLSGNGNNFTLYNGVGFSTESGGCLTFDGIDDYVASSSNLNLTSYDYVVVELFYKTNNNTHIAMMFEHTSNWNSNTGGFGMATNADGNNVLANCNHTNHNTSVARNYLVNNNSTWINNLNLYSKISDSTGRLTYVNSTLVSFTSIGGYATGTATSTGQFANAIFYIGSRGGSSSFLNGKVSSLKIYGFKINASQALQNYSALKSRFGI